MWFSGIPGAQTPLTNPPIPYSGACSVRGCLPTRSSFPRDAEETADFSLLPAPRQSVTSFSPAGQVLQCNSPSRAPHSLRNQAEARLLLKSHLCPAFALLPSPASLSQHLEVSPESYLSINHVHKNPHLRL